MKASSKNKANRMRKADCVKLAKQGRELLKELGFTRTAQPDGDPSSCWTGEKWEATSERFGCPLILSPVWDNDGHPTLFARFERPSSENRDPAGTYADIRKALGGEQVNQFSGKFNTYVFERMSVDDALDVFAFHLRQAGPFKASK